MIQLSFRFLYIKLWQHHVVTITITLTVVRLVEPVNAIISIQCFGSSRKKSLWKRRCKKKTTQRFKENIHESMAAFFWRKYINLKGQAAWSCTKCCKHTWWAGFWGWLRHSWSWQQICSTSAGLLYIFMFFSSSHGVKVFKKTRKQHLDQHPESLSNIPILWWVFCSMFAFFSGPRHNMLDINVTRLHTSCRINNLKVSQCMESMVNTWHWHPATLIWRVVIQGCLFKTRPLLYTVL